MPDASPPRVITAPARLRGDITVPGDKSISHRAVLFNAVAVGHATIGNFLPGADCLSTIACMRALGATIEVDGTRVSVSGTGIAGLQEPADVLDAGNSGTTMRLLAGMLAGAPLFAVLTGDASLRRRPMDRIIEPLTRMGARIQGRRGGSLAPLAIHGSQLRGLVYHSPVASAQVKSAILLAGLHADGPTVVVEPARSRDHSERLLATMGASLEVDGTSVILQPLTAPLRAIDIEVPGDISSAAFWLVAGAAHPDADLMVRNVGINPTRAGALHVLRRMGANLELRNERIVGGEPVADIRVRSSELRATDIGGNEIPTLIDEIPALVVAALHARGTTTVRDASELRVKESDRIATVAGHVGRFQGRIEERPDGFVIDGGTRLRGTTADPQADHRLAMSLAIAGLLAAGETSVADPDCVAVSYPGFWGDLDRVSQG